MGKSSRRGPRILACVAALSLLPALALPATAAPPEVKLDQGKKTYIVQLASDPIAGYDGGVRGIPATKPAPGAKVNVKSANAKAYEKVLLAEQAKALKSAGVATKARKAEYTVALNGFSAELTAAQAARMRKTAGVVNVWEDEIRHADTVTTPDYLGLSGESGVWQTQFDGDSNAGKGIVVGVIDTGIDPGNPSFASLDGAEMPAGNFACVTGTDPDFECSTKIVGARYYGADFGNNVSFDVTSPRDTNGHGSHTAGTAAGNHGIPMSIMGNDLGHGSGMAPAAHIAVYKALWQTADGNGSGTTAGLVAAIDDAVADGVDVINYSISGSSDYVVSSDEIAFLYAADAGVFVSTSAGNSGDTIGESSVAHNSPWTMTVAASTHDRGVRNSLTTGDEQTYEGVGFGGPQASTPMVLASAIPADGVESAEADLCATGAVDDTAAKGKIVVCTRGGYPLVDKGAEVKNSGGAGMVLVNAVGAATSLNAIMYGLPATHLSAEDGVEVKKYVSGADAPTGSISVTEPVTLEAPAMASFSSYGPALAGGGDLLKPDITAPGVDVIAAYSQDPESAEPRFESLQGTSMSAPHIAGLGALLKQEFPKWSPMAIKSAMMTTARQTTNEGNPIQWGSQDATPLNYGAGEVVPARSYNPGLVFDSNWRDWYAYACAINQLQLVGGAGYCDSIDPVDASDLNYPTISVGDLAGYQVVTRKVTNVTTRKLQFTPNVEAPAGFTVNVTPKKLTVPAGKTAQFKVEFTRTTAPLGEFAFGAVTWSPVGGAQVEPVRSAIAVRPVALAAPSEVIGAGASGSTDITVIPGFTGTLNTDVDGLLASTTEDVSVVPATDTQTAFEVAPGTKVLRLASYDAEVDADDIDLYLFRCTEDGCSQVGQSGAGGSDEMITLTNPATTGTYVLLTDLFSEDVESVTFPLHMWQLGDAAAGNLTVDPSSVSVTQGIRTTVTASWTGLEAAKRYLGQVNFLNGTEVAGSTLVTVNP